MDSCVIAWYGFCLARKTDEDRFSFVIGPENQHLFSEAWGERSCILELHLFVFPNRGAG